MLTQGRFFYKPYVRSRSVSAAVLIYIVGMYAIWSIYLAGLRNFECFFILFVVTVLTNFPKKALSPLSVFYAYYGLWFIVAPIFAERYAGKLEDPSYALSIAMAYTVFGLGVIFIQAGQRLGDRFRTKSVDVAPIGPDLLKFIILVLYIIST